MAQKNYKINEAIDVVYQAPGAATGQIVTMEIYDESGVKDPALFPDFTMIEVAAGVGRYRGSFIPDEEGEWEVHISVAGGDGQVVKQYSVGQHNVGGIGEILTGMDIQLDAVEVKIDGLDSPPMVG